MSGAHVVNSVHKNVFIPAACNSLMGFIKRLSEMALCHCILCFGLKVCLVCGKQWRNYHTTALSILVLISNKTLWLKRRHAAANVFFKMYSNGPVFSTLVARLCGVFCTTFLPQKFCAIA